jgi:hypothetical protein
MCVRTRADRVPRGPASCPDDKRLRAGRNLNQAYTGWEVYADSAVITGNTIYGYQTSGTMGFAGVTTPGYYADAGLFRFYRGNLSAYTGGAMPTMTVQR